MVNRLSRYLVWGFLIFLCSPVANCWGQSEPTIQEVRQDLKDDREEMHSYLFNDLILGREYYLARNGELLTEVKVHQFEDDRRRVFEVELNEEIYKVCSMFDQIVVKAENPRDIARVQLIVGEDSFELTWVYNERGGVDPSIFRLPPLHPVSPGVGRPVLKIYCRGITSLRGIHFLSSKGIEKDYERNYQRIRFRSDDALQTYADVANSIGIQSLPEKRPTSASLMSGGLEVIQMLGVLANRKMLIMHEILSRMDQEQASVLAREHFDSEFARFQEAFKRANILPERMMNGMRIHLFLCAEFCTPEEFVQKVGQWREWMARNLHLDVYGGPDTVMLINLYANMIAEKDQMSDSDLRNWLTENLLEGRSGRLPTFTYEPMFTSDSFKEQRIWSQSIRVFRNSYSLDSRTNSKKFAQHLKILDAKLLGE